MTMDGLTLTWKHGLIALGIVAALSSSGGAAVTSLRPSVTLDDLERLDTRRDKRLASERERAELSYADAQDVTRLGVQITQLERQIVELTGEVRALRNTRSEGR